MIYRILIRPILFFFDAEKVHSFTIGALGKIGNVPLARKIVESVLSYRHPALSQEMFGIAFPTPIGLAAGMDKNAEAVNAWGVFSFGYVEVGSVTLFPQPGNPKPRLWRIPSEKTIIVNYGLSSDGARAVRARIKKLKERNIPIGLSIAKTTKVTDEGTGGDYLESFRLLYDVADYFTLNVSCPNVQHFISLQKDKFLRGLVAGIQKENLARENKPVFVKISPDNSPAELDRIISTVQDHKITGIIATNLTKRKTPGVEEKRKGRPGGLSGRLTREHSNRTVRYIYKKTGGKLPIIGVGGVFTARDAYEKIKAGASLLQIATGFIYGGPAAIRRINRGLVKLLAKDGYKHISQAVGTEHKRP